MEMLVALFLLAYAEKDDAFREKLKQILAFYRENRELLATIAQGKTFEPHEPPETHETHEPPETHENPQQKSSPRTEESLRILDEFLKKV